MGKIVLKTYNAKDEWEDAVAALGEIQQHGKQKVVALKPEQALRLTTMLGALLVRNVLYEGKLYELMGQDAYEDFMGMVALAELDEDGAIKWQLPEDEDVK